MSKSELLGLENDWKEITTSGNELIKNTQNTALLKYKVALEKAEQLMEHQKACVAYEIPVMPIFLISCNNLAEAFCALEQWNDAEKMLKRGLYYILFLNKQQLHPQSEALLSPWFFKQSLLYKDFADQSQQSHKYQELLEELKTDIQHYRFD